MNLGWKTLDPEVWKSEAESTVTNFDRPLRVSSAHGNAPQQTPAPGRYAAQKTPPLVMPVERQFRPHSKFLGRMFVKLNDKLVLVQLRDVFWIQSRGNLLRLHLRDADYDHRMTMKDILLQLDPGNFLRVHRNAIVNLDHVADFDLPRYGNAFVHLRNGTALPISRTGRTALRRNLLSRAYAEADAS